MNPDISALLRSDKLILSVKYHLGLLSCGNRTFVNYSLELLAVRDMLNSGDCLTLSLI
jgi:hypothetical protein